MYICESRVKVSMVKRLRCWTVVCRVEISSPTRITWAWLPLYALEQVPSLYLFHASKKTFSHWSRIMCSYKMCKLRNVTGYKREGDHPCLSTAQGTVIHSRSQECCAVNLKNGKPKNWTYSIQVELIAMVSQAALDVAYECNFQLKIYWNYS